MALTKTTKPSIIKTRSQSRIARTGTNVRTNDDTIAPAPVAVVAPVPLTDDLFSGRLTTGAFLKDPPPAPRDSDAKKPPAKPQPKGRPKKVAPKATRKPRESRTAARVDANELVDPMANIHVGDDATGVVTADRITGGLARAGGNDPVLADKDYSNPEQPEDPEQPEPQPKKKTRRTTRASRAHRAGHGDDDDDEDSYSTVRPGTGGYGNGGNGGEMMMITMTLTLMLTLLQTARVSLKHLECMPRSLSVIPLRNVDFLCTSAALLSTVLIRLGRCYTSSTSRLGMMSVSNPTMIL